MATARKPFIRIGTSLLREPWTRDEKATLVMLACFLGDRWARDRLTAAEAGHATLTRDQLHSITGRSQLAHARRALSVLGARVSLAIQVRGQFTEIHWPKFAEFQELPSRGRDFKTRRKPESAPAPAHAHTRTPTGCVTEAPSAPRRAPKDLTLFDSGELVPSDDAVVVAAGQLVNALSREPGTRDEKLAWLERELPLIALEVSALPGIETRRQANRKLVSTAIRWWRQEQRNPGGRARESFDDQRIREGREWLESL